MTVNSDKHTTKKLLKTVNPGYDNQLGRCTELTSSSAIAYMRIISAELLISERYLFLAAKELINVKVSRPLIFQKVTAPSGSHIKLYLLLPKVVAKINDIPV